MADRAPFLTKAYSGYHHRERPAEDEELTRVGPGTPCGEYLRRFWQPIVLSGELGELPRRLRILGEDLVAFRDKSGAIGLLELHCPHRGTSLEFGLIGDKGIRCCYHGWLFGVDGTIIETPGEPADSTLKERLFHGAYPVHEHAGLVFAYLGPPDKQPPFPVLDTYDLPGYRLVPRAGNVWECNWLQVKENSMDPAHLAFLHTLPGSEGFTDDLGALGEWDWMETPAGMVVNHALSELTQRQLCDENRARRIETLDDRGVGIDYLVLERARAPSRLVAADGEKILRAPRNAVKRTTIFSPPDFRIGCIPIPVIP